MLDKLELAYLSILRFAVIVISGLLLIAVVIFSTSYIKSVFSSKPDENLSVKTNKQAIFEILAADENVKSNQILIDPKEKLKSTEHDNIIYFRRAEAALSKFVASNYVNGKIQSEKFIEYLDGVTREYKDPIVANNFSSSLAEVIEGLASDPKMVALTKKTEAGDFASKLMEAFIENFNAEYDKANKKIIADKENYVKNQTAAEVNLYYAIGGFSLFIFIVFMSIVVKIERNLRLIGEK